MNAMCRSLVIAAKEMGIPSIDIQHGVAGDVHKSYYKWLKMPINGYKLFPNYFWSWTAKDMEVFSNWQKDKNYIAKPILGGNVLTNAWKNKLIPEFANSTFQFSSLCNKEQINVLVSVQLNGISPIIIEAIQNSGYQIKWWIRLHPRVQGQINKFKDELKLIWDDRKIDIENATKLPLMAIMENIDCHVTEYSTVTLDAADFGVNTVFINEEGFNLFEESLPPNTKWLVKSYSDLLRMVEKQSKENLKSKAIVVEDFSKNGIEQIINLIHEG
jgi:hypothetical protein